MKINGINIKEIGGRKIVKTEILKDGKVLVMQEGEKSRGITIHWKGKLTKKSTSARSHWEMIILGPKDWEKINEKWDILTA